MACGCHNLNQVLCDVATSCPKALLFVGVFHQCAYSLFSSLPKRRKFLQDNILDQQTHWESRIENVKPIRFQYPQIRDALFELTEVSEDPKIKVEAKCLVTYELKNFELLLGMTIQCDILFAMNTITKSLQKEYRQIDVAINQLKCLTSFLENYRKNGLCLL